MRLMILRAALFAADAELAAGAADVQAPAPEQPPFDNDHVAAGCEQFGDPASDAGSGHCGGFPQAAQIGLPVVVRQHGKLVAGIVVEEDVGEGIAVQLFRGDHSMHAAHHLKRVKENETVDGWFHPWERRPQTPES